MAKRVLAVDDESDIRTIIEAVLISKGYEIDTAVDGEDALMKLNQAKYDLVVLDIMMPKLDGYGVLKEIRQRGLTKLPVVMLTAKSTDKDVWKGYEEGVTYYITKPFENVRLANIIDYLIGDLTPQEKSKLETQL
jgi:DNA-binding response OmpR family regulator